MAISAKDVMALRQKTGAGMMDCKKSLTETDGDLDSAIKLLREKGMAAAKKRVERETSEGRIAVKVSEDGTAGAIVEVNSETDFVARNSQFIELVNEYADRALENGESKAVDRMVPVDAFDLAKLQELSGKIGEKMTLRRAGFISSKGSGLIDRYVHPGDQLGTLIELGGDERALNSDAAKGLAHDLALQIAAATPQYVSRKEVPDDVIEREKEIYKAQMRNEGKPEAILDKIANGKLNKFFEDNCLLDQQNVKEMKQRISERIAEAAKESGGEIKVVSFLRFKVGEGTTGE